MSETEQMGTQPLPEHAWLKHLIGEWKVSTDMMSPDGTGATAIGTESVRTLGGLWAVGEGNSVGEGGFVWSYVTGVGFDVSSKQFRSFWVQNVSSHLWNSSGHLSADQKVLTLDCVGPHFTEDRDMNYRDVHTLVDENTRTITSFVQDDAGEWTQIMVITYTRA